jgi:hypothetical protein
MGKRELLTGNREQGRLKINIFLIPLYLIIEFA